MNDHGSSSPKATNLCGPGTISARFRVQIGLILAFYRRAFSIRYATRSLRGITRANRRPFRVESNSRQPARSRPRKRPAAMDPSSTSRLQRMWDAANYPTPAEKTARRPPAQGTPSPDLGLQARHPIVRISPPQSKLRPHLARRKRAAISACLTAQKKALR